MHFTSWSVFCWSWHVGNLSHHWVFDPNICGKITRRSMHLVHHLNLNEQASCKMVLCLQLKKCGEKISGCLYFVYLIYIKDRTYVMPVKLNIIYIKDRTYVMPVKLNISGGLTSALFPTCHHLDLTCHRLKTRHVLTAFHHPQILE